MMNQNKAAFFEQLHENVSYDLHLGGVVLVGIVDFSEYVDNSQSWVTLLHNLGQPGTVSVVKNVYGQLHIFRVNSVQLTGQVNTKSLHVKKSLTPDHFTRIELEKETT